MKSFTRRVALQGGMRGFLVVWLGQLVSLLGTAMTTFGLTIWAFTETGRATELAIVGVFYTVPLLLMSPLAGVIVDRYNRKLIMMLSDVASGLATIAILGLFVAGRLEIWHLYVSAAVQGTFQATQWPAYSAAISLMIPKEHYTRANSLMGLAGPASQIVAPLLAGALLGIVGLGGILTIDIVTFLFAVGTLAFIAIPEPENKTAPEGSIWQDMLFGFRYIWQRPPLLLLQTVFMTGNFFYSMAFVLLAPLILLRTDNNELLFGALQTVGAVGAVLGGIFLGIWGGFQRRVYGVLLGWGISLVSLILISLDGGSTFWAGMPVWAAGMFIGAFTIPLINSSNQAIWQAKVPPEMQGRVFSIRSMIAMAVVPLSAIAGPLADQVMEPAMQSDTILAALFGGLVGTGPGAGMALILMGCGVVGILLAAGGYLLHPVREVEILLPDFDSAASQ